MYILYEMYIFVYKEIYSHFYNEYFSTVTHYQNEQIIIVGIFSLHVHFVF